MTKQNILLKTKICARCGIQKPIDCFYKKTESKDGYASTCKICSNILVASWVKVNKEKRKVIYTRSRKAHIETHREASRQWSKNHPENGRINAEQWRLNNIEKVKEIQKKSCRKRLKDIVAYNAKRRADKKSQTPIWANLGKIKQIYKDCPAGMAVDHIVPLKGKLVSGFHVEYNLQYLTKSENSKKGNKLILGV